MYRRIAMRILIVAIIFVLFRIYYKVNNCLTSGGNWNAKADTCTPRPVPKEIQKAK